MKKYSFNDVYNANKETKELVEKNLIRKMTGMTGKNRSTPPKICCQAVILSS